MGCSRALGPGPGGEAVLGFADQAWASGPRLGGWVAYRPKAQAQEQEEGQGPNPTHTLRLTGPGLPLGAQGYLEVTGSLKEGYPWKGGFGNLPPARMGVTL